MLLCSQLLGHEYENTFLIISLQRQLQLIWTFALPRARESGLGSHFNGKQARSLRICNSWFSKLELKSIAINAAHLCHNHSCWSRILSPPRGHPVREGLLGEPHRERFFKHLFCLHRSKLVRFTSYGRRSQENVDIRVQNPHGRGASTCYRFVTTADDLSTGYKTPRKCIRPIPICGT
jgi:hypothetical protein